MGDNPFKKVDGGNKSPTPAPSAPPQGIEVDQELSNLCPFIGTMPVIAPSSQILTQGGQMPPVQHVMSPCLGGRCAMWDADNEDCSIKIANEAMLDIVGPLEALAKAFGKK